MIAKIDVDASKCYLAGVAAYLPVNITFCLISIAFVHNESELARRQARKLRHG